MSRLFEGSAAGALEADTVLECGVCWWVYDPAKGDPDNDIAPGMAFTDLPSHWRCPSCDADKAKFMVLDGTTPMATGASHQSIDERLAALTAAYGEADDKMIGLPIYNGALKIEMVGFRPYQDMYAGVVITPWCMNIVLLPQDAAAQPAAAIGASRQHVFPSGSYSFIMGRMEPIGALETCSLFSPMDEFPDMEAAKLAANAVAEALFEAPEEEAPKPKTVTRRFILTQNGERV